jgi:hypothetical protein
MPTLGESETGGVLFYRREKSLVASNATNFNHRLFAPWTPARSNLTQWKSTGHAHPKFCVHRTAQGAACARLYADPKSAMSVDMGGIFWCSSTLRKRC